MSVSRRNCSLGHLTLRFSLRRFADSSRHPAAPCPFPPPPPYSHAATRFVMPCPPILLGCSIVLQAAFTTLSLFVKAAMRTFLSQSQPLRIRGFLSLVRCA